MGNMNSINRINFKDVQYAIASNMVIINTLDINNQDCLIKNTLKPEDEINVINDIIQKGRFDQKILYMERIVVTIVL